MVGRGVCASFLLVPVVLLAGCSKPGADEGAEDDGIDGDDGPATPAAYPYRMSADGCDEVTILALVDPAHLEGFLPAGYMPADASRLLGTPTELRQGAVLLTSAACESATVPENRYDEGAIGISVEPPAFDGVDAADYHFYVLAMVMGDGLLRDHLEALDWNLLGTVVEVDVQDGAVFEGFGSVQDGPAVFYSAVGGGAAAAEQPVAGTFRWWHENRNGTGFVDYAFSTELHLLRSDCLVDPSSLASEVSRIRECRGSTAIVAVARDFSFDLTMQWFPGRSAAP